MLELSLDTSLNINQSPWYPYFFKYHPEQEKKSTPIYPSHQALKSYEPKTNHWSWPKHPKIQFPIDPGSPHILGPKEVSMFSRPCTTWTLCYYVNKNSIIIANTIIITNILLIIIIIIISIITIISIISIIIVVVVVIIIITIYPFWEAKFKQMKETICTARQSAGTKQPKAPSNRTISPTRGKN